MAAFLDHRTPIDPLKTPIEDQERHERLRMEHHIQTKRSLARACQQILQVQNHPGYKGYAQEVVKLRDRANSLLIKSIDTAEMRIEQGKVLAFDAILSILNSQESDLKRLAIELEQVENHHKATVMPDGRLKPIGVI
jgi:hypothetical protein